MIAVCSAIDAGEEHHSGDQSRLLQPDSDADSEVTSSLFRPALANERPISSLVKPGIGIMAVIDPVRLYVDRDELLSSTSLAAPRANSICTPPATDSCCLFQSSDSPELVSSAHDHDGSVQCDVVNGCNRTDAFDGFKCCLPSMNSGPQVRQSFGYTSMYFNDLDKVQTQEAIGSDTRKLSVNEAGEVENTHLDDLENKINTELVRYSVM